MNLFYTVHNFISGLPQPAYVSMFKGNDLFDRYNL